MDRVRQNIPKLNYKDIKDGKITSEDIAHLAYQFKNFNMSNKEERSEGELGESDISDVECLSEGEEEAREDNERHAEDEWLSMSEEDFRTGVCVCTGRWGSEQTGNPH